MLAYYFYTYLAAVGGRKQFRYFRPSVCHDLSKPVLRLQDKYCRVHRTQAMGFEELLAFLLSTGRVRGAEL